MKLPRVFLGSEEAAPKKRGVNLDVPSENVLSLRKKTFKIEIDPEKVVQYIIERKKIFAPLSVLLVFGILFSISLTGKADVVNFYPKTCLGGWENPSGAEGQPSVPEQAAISDFTKNNSAFLDNRNAQIFCGDFSGDIPEDTTPRALKVRFSLFVDDGTMDREASVRRPKIEDSINPVVAPTTPQEVSPQSTDTSSSDVQQIPSVETPSQDVPADATTETPVVTPENLPSSTLELNQLNQDTSSGSSSDTPSPDSGSSSSGDTNSGVPSGDSSGGASVDNAGPSGFLQMITNKAHAQEAPASDSVPVDASPVLDTLVSDPVLSPGPDAPSSSTSDTLPSDTAPVSTDAPASSEGAPSELTAPEDMSNVSLVDIPADASSAVVPSAQDTLFKITYTLDGQNWDTLGVVQKGGWQNLEFEIPINVIEASWEKLAHLQISVDALQTIDQFPKTYLDSMWISVEYQKTDPDPNPQPDFNSDKVLQDVRYDQYRIIKILRPNGKYQMWYAFIPDELLNVQNTPDGQLPSGVDVIKSGDESLQVIDGSALPVDQPTFSGDTASTTLPSDSGFVPEPSTHESLPQKDVTPQNIFDTISNALGAEAVNGSNPSPQIVSSVENTSGTGVATATSDIPSSINQHDQASRQENVSDIPVDKPTDLNSLKAPEWHWDLLADDASLHPEYHFGVDGGVVVWIDKKGEAINAFILASKGTMSQTYRPSSNNTYIEFVNVGGEKERADYDSVTNTFIFSKPQF